MKNTTNLYRDCLRLVNHIAGNSKKGQNLRQMVGREFRKNMGEKDEKVIEGMKSNAIKALANYLMMESLSKDSKFKERANAFTTSELDALKRTPDNT